jgi:hypothetical protein
MMIEKNTYADGKLYVLIMSCSGQLEEYPGYFEKINLADFF